MRHNIPLLSSLLSPLHSHTPLSSQNLVSSSQNTSSTRRPPVEIPRNIRPRQILQIRATALEIRTRADKEIKAGIIICVEDALSCWDIDDLVESDAEFGADAGTGLFGSVVIVADVNGLGG